MSSANAKYYAKPNVCADCESECANNSGDAGSYAFANGDAGSYGSYAESYAMADIGSFIMHAGGIGSFIMHAPGVPSMWRQRCLIEGCIHGDDQKRYL